MFDDDDRRYTLDLVTYLNTKGYNAKQDLGGKVSISKGGAGSPAIFWNGQRVLDKSVLNRFDMSDMDYIIFDLSNTQYDGQMIGREGSIHLYTDLKLRFKFDKRKIFDQEIKAPLTFTSSKQFYVPKYVYYNSDFFREYGVIDWLPNVTLDQSNAINLKVLDTKTKQIKLFIEGVTNEGRYISEEKVITIN
ncbi:MAG: hypothetical protein ACJARX_002396 [Psychroserpens sp.]|jgi:hypothetical protein